jgi:hypothetical protein
MVNSTRTWKLKIENKDLLFVAFQLKTLPKAKSQHESSYGLRYTQFRVSLAEY